MKGELYRPFVNGAINPTQENIDSSNRINTCIRNCVLNGMNDEYFTLLTSDEVGYCLNKINLISNTINEKKNFILLKQIINKKNS